MQHIKFYCIIFAGLLAMSCTTQQPIAINNAMVYHMEINKESYSISKDSLPQATMIWLKKDETCDARFEAGHTNICFKYSGKPDYQVLIKNEDSNEQLGSISKIKKFESTFIHPDGEEYTLKPVRGVLTAIHNKIPIARVTVKKRNYNMEMDEKYFSDELLKAAILYKHAAFQKMNNEIDDELIVLMILLSAM